jgi:hypothetical protein
VLLLLLEPGICCAVNAVLYLDAGRDYFRTAYWTYAALVIMRVARCVKEKAMREKYGIFVRNKRASWTEELITSISSGLSLAVDAVDQEDFMGKCLAASEHKIPKGGKRDTRRQDLTRALRRMAARDRLPFRVAGDQFVF